ncbi:MAG: potassium transporter TrkA [Acidimicrobiales bacterium]|nr:MAG: potassium transporter TrkA [Acidimicrobiales bacterium]
MHVVILGCGRTGATLAHDLLQRSHTVAIIDRDIAAFRRLGNGFEGRVVTGNGFDKGVLLQAGIEQAEAFAAVANGDNSNIIAVRVARETFGVSRVIARIYDARRAEVYERLGIPTIATVRWAAHRMLRALCPSEDPEIWRDPTSMVALITPALHPDWVGRRLTEWELQTGARVAYITRFGIATLPTSSMVLGDGDQLAALVTDAIADRVVSITSSSPVESSISGAQ